MEYGSIFETSSNRAFTREGSGFLQSDWQLFRSGRDAMKALARTAGRRRVLLPALCCESMLVPFARNDYELVFYRLQEDLRGDERDVLNRLRDGDIFLYLSYFGIRPFSDTFLENLRTSGRDLLLVEDRTQDLIAPRPACGFQPDAMVASLRKWAALPEGGVLQTALAPCPAGEDSAFGDLCRKAQGEKDRYLADWVSARKQAFLAQFHEAETLLDEGGEPVAMSAEYRGTAANLDFGAIYAARRRNLLHLKARLEPLSAAGRLRFLSDSPADSTLYLPILLEDRDRVQRAMAEEKIYCPVIWPQPAETAGVCPVSCAVTKHMLALPVDQRYREAEMDFFADTLEKILK